MLRSENRSTIRSNSKLHNHGTKYTRPCMTYQGAPSQNSTVNYKFAVYLRHSRKLKLKYTAVCGLQKYQIFRLLKKEIRWLVLFVYSKPSSSPKLTNVGKYFKRVFYLLVINILAAHISDFTSSLSEPSRFKNFVKKTDHCGIRVNLRFYPVNKAHKGQFL